MEDIDLARPDALDALDAATTPSNGAKPEERLRPPILDHMKPSGLKQHYVVETDDGRFLEVHTNAADVLRWEKTFKKGWFDEEGVSFERMVFIAWAAWKRTQPDQEIEAFPEFRAHVVDMHVDPPDEDDVDPTQSMDGDA